MRYRKDLRPSKKSSNSFNTYILEPGVTGKKQKIAVVIMSLDARTEAIKLLTRT